MVETRCPVRSAVKRQQNPGAMSVFGGRAALPGRLVGPGDLARLRTFANLALVLGTVSLGCGDASTSTNLEAGDSAETAGTPARSGSSGNPGPSTTPGSGDPIFAPSGPSNSGGTDCSEAAKLVYVLSSENALYSFAPANKKFTRIATLQCDVAKGMVVNSMAIDRNAKAWVNFLDPLGVRPGNPGILAAVDTKTSRCTGETIPLKGDWAKVGMGYSTAGQDSKTESLFVASSNPKAGLARVDVAGKAIVPVGAFDIPTEGINLGVVPELTGTGDGRLYGVFFQSQVRLAELNAKSGKVLKSMTIPGIENEYTAFAMSFWGGRFYVYSEPKQNGFDGGSSKVTEVDLTTGKVNSDYMTDVGFAIVGAGVSTCAPVTQPR